jgi:TP901 family phage tail tape measure protein
LPSNSKMISITLKLIDNFSGGLDAPVNKMQKLGSTMTAVGAGMTAAITAPLVMIGKAAVETSMQFETAMTNLQSVTKQSDAEIAALGETLKTMSMDLSKTTDSAQNLAEALYDVVGSGFEGADAIKVLEAATMAASAGLTETKVAAQGITAVINSYGMAASDATHISDLLFQTVNVGVGTFEELVGSMSNVVGTADAAGVSFEEVSAAMATMSKQGMSFSEASVSLNQGILAFLKPSEQMAKAISELGYVSGQAMVDALGFGGAMAAVSEHVGGSADAMAGLFGDVRSLKAALALTGNGAQMFAQDLETMQNATGATAEAFAIQTQSFEATLKNFQNTWGVMLIEIGNAIKPVLTAIMQFITPLMQAFIALPAPIKTAIVAFLALLAAIGPILLIVGQLIMAWTAVSGAIAAVGGVAAIAAGTMSFLGAAFTALTGPIGIAIAALALLKVAWDRDFLGLKTKIQEMPNVWRKNFEMLGQIFQLGVQKFMKFNIDIAKLIQENGLVKTMKEFGANIIQGLIDGIKSKVAQLVGVVLNMAAKVTNGIKSALKIQSPSKVMMGLGENAVKGFNEGIATMGGIGVQVPALAGAGASVSTAPTASGNMGGGSGGNVYIENMTIPPGTTKEQIDFIMKEIGKRVKLRGGS